MARLAQAEGYVAGLVLAVPLVPGVVAIATVAAYMVLPQAGIPAPKEPDAVPSIVIGVLVTLAIWLAVGLLLIPAAGAQKAQPEVYSELKRRHQELRDRLEAVPNPGPIPAVRGHIAATLDRVGAALDADGPALRWALAHGYLSILRDLHDVEEHLILIESDEAVEGDAIDDDLALEDSVIENSSRLRSMLRASIQRISPETAATYLPPEAGTATLAAAGLNPITARETILTVHHAIKDFRDRAREELVRQRNRLIVVMLVLAAVTYVLLCLALVLHVPREQVVAASVFYLVGAVVGLFQRVNTEAGRKSAGDDFGLYEARLLVAPVLSGLAALGGVYLVAAAPAFVQATANLSSAGTAVPTVNLSDVFSLTNSNQISLLYAAIFGMTPGLLTGQLDKQASRLETALESTTSATPGTP